MLFALAVFAAVLAPVSSSSHPIPDRPLASLLSDSDYPAGAIRREVSGTVAFRLEVGADGAPTHCTILQSVDPELDQTTCDIFMARAHFQPARDTQGRAVASSISTRVRWDMPPPEDAALLFAVTRMANVIRLDAQGNITCTQSTNGELLVEVAVECGLFPDSGAVQAMRALAVPAHLILIFDLVPQGETAMTGNEEANAQLIHEETAHLAIAPVGTVDCHPRATHNVQTPLAIHFPSACWMQGGPPFVSPAPNQETRQAETSIRVYIRRDPAR